jgi:hypothetical protein
MLRRTVARAFAPSSEGVEEKASLASGVPTHLLPGFSLRWTRAVDQVFDDLRETLGVLVAQEASSSSVPGPSPGERPAEENRGGSPTEESPGGDSQRSRGKTRPPGEDRPEAGTSSRGVASPSEVSQPASVTLSKPKPRFDGLEFLLSGPGGALRCVHTLRGFLRVRWVEKADESTKSERREFQELLSVQSQGGVYRPIRKPLPAPPQEGGWASEAPSRQARKSFAFTSVPELAREYFQWVSLPG